MPGIKHAKVPKIQKPRNPEGLLDLNLNEDINKDTDYGSVESLQFIFIACIIGAFFSLIIFFHSWAKHEWGLLVFQAVSFSVFLLLIFLVRIARQARLSGIIMTVFLAVSLVYGVVIHNPLNVGMLFLLPLSIIVFHLFGKKAGLIVILTAMVGTALVYYFGHLPEGMGRFSAKAVFSVLILSFLILTYFIYMHEEREEFFLKTLREKVYSDSLTGLPNRVQLMEDIKSSVYPVLIIVNVDDFKEINDIFGYSVGDKVIAYLGDRLREVLPTDGHKLYRLVADEYAVLIELSPSQTQTETILSLVNLIRHYVYAKKYVTPEFEILLRVSMGIAIGEVTGRENLFMQADIALKSGKKGNKPYMFFKFEEAQATRTLFRNNIQIASMLSNAIETNEIMAYYQPIIDNKTKLVYKYECLVRIRDRDHNVVLPGVFLELAKKSRLQIFLTRAVMLQAIERFKKKDCMFSVNISFQDMENVHTRNFIYKQLEATPAIQKRICFEILESEGIENYGIVSDFITKVKQMGCKIAVDDFGSGYSNFEHVLRLNIDYLKIDGSLIRDIDVNRNSQIIVKTIVDFAHQMGIKTVAEYVHSDLVYKMVQELGIDYSQGFFIGKPECDLLENENFN